MEQMKQLIAVTHDEKTRTITITNHHSTLFACASDYPSLIHPQSLTVRPWKVTFPIGKACLPTTSFQGLAGQAVKLYGCKSSISSHEDLCVRSNDHHQSSHLVWSTDDLQEQEATETRHIFSKSRLTGIHQQKSLHRNLQGSNFHRGSIYIYIIFILYGRLCYQNHLLLYAGYLISAFSCFHAAHLSILWWLPIPKYIRGFEGGGDSGIRSHLDFWWFLWLWFRDQPSDIPQAWNIKGITECVKRLPNITNKLKGNGKHGLNQLVLPMHHNASITSRRRTSSNFPLSSFASVSSMLRC